MFFGDTFPSSGVPDSVNFITTLSSDVKSLLFFGGVILVELEACPTRRLLSINAIASKIEMDKKIQVFKLYLIAWTSILGFEFKLGYCPNFRTSREILGKTVQ